MDKPPAKGRAKSSTEQKPVPPNLAADTAQNAAADTGAHDIKGQVGETKAFVPAEASRGKLTESVIKDNEAANYLLAEEDVAAPVLPAAPTVAPSPPTVKSDHAPAKAAPSELDAPAESGKVRILGDYRILKKIGGGGMGTVYQAVQISLDRPVALKVLSPELAAKPEFVQRFQREARLMARLDHPNILRSVGIGQVGQWRFLAMEFADGGSLEEVLRRHGKLSVADALHVVLACAQGLQHAHENKLVHRDVKPDNVLLTKKGQIKLADLGLAKADDDNLALTKTGAGAGTPYYMSPEQGRDAKRVDARSDIYSLGCMLYRMLSGEVPFKGDTMIQVVEAKELGKFTPLRQLNAEVPSRLDLILDKMLAADPRHRFQSCTELIAELTELGLAGDELSVLGDPTVKSVQRGSASRSVAETSARTTVAPAGQTTDEDGDSADMAREWYIALTLPNGRRITNQVSTYEITQLIQDGSITPSSKVSRQPKGPFRTLNTFPELASIVRAARVKKDADRKTIKFRDLYDKIVQEEETRQRRRWMHNLFLRVGGFCKFLLWLVVVFVILIIAFYLARWGIVWLAEKLEIMTKT
jgi:serine/threonine-protein kinase